MTEKIKLRFHNKSDSLDEIHASNSSVHVEQMSDDCFWMEIKTGKEVVSVNFFLAKEAVTDEGGDTFRPIVLKVQEKRNL